ncbi:hypothetical protein Tco_0469045 [Tanacetum coccineum]
MTTLANKAILSGVDNHPPMLEKELYDSWKSRMELYMTNRQLGRMILESVENGPLIWPTIEENGVTRPRKYCELTPAEAIQADCDVNATNIILQGLPTESPQYGSPYQSQQYSINQSSTPLSITYLSNDYQSSVHHNVYTPSSSIPQLEYVHTVNQQQQQPEFPQLDSGLIVPVFKQGDDPIDAINHIMSFLTAVVTSRYPTTNNQLRNSSNPRQQATINDERVTLQPIQGRQTSFAADTTRTYTPAASGSNYGKQRIVIYPGIAEGQATQTVITYNACKMLVLSTDDLVHLTLIAMPSSEQSSVVNNSETEITSDSNIIPYSHYVKESQQAAIPEYSIVNDTLTIELERYKEQVKVLKEGQIVDLKSKDNISDSCEQSVEIDRLKQTISKHLKETESLIQTVTLLKHHLAGFNVVVKERTIATAITEGSWGVSNLIVENEHLKQAYKQLYDSNLKKCLADANLHVPLDEIKVDKTLRFVEEPLEIMDREVKTLKRSKIPIVKVRWNSKRGPEFTWEREDHMKAKYP